MTWKADGTRYMLLLCRNGTYLVDRKFAVTRVQMRWPTPRASGQQLKGPVGPAHHLVSAGGTGSCVHPPSGCSRHRGSQADAENLHLPVC